MPAAGSKGGPKNPGELKDDTSSSREEKKVWYFYELRLRLENVLVEVEAELFDSDH